MPSDAPLACASWLNSFVVCARAAETESSFALAEQNIASILRRHPRGVAILLIVLHHDKAPENYTDKMLGLLKRFRPQLLCAAAVIEASGFAGAGQRALGASVITLSGMGRMLGIFNTLEASSEFMAQHMFAVEQRVAGQAGLLSAVRHFRHAVHTEMLQTRSSAGTP